MSFKSVNGYVLTVAGGLVLLAAGLLVALQWDNTCQFSLYGKRVDPVTSVVILVSGLAGWLTPKVFRILFKGIAKIRKARKEYKKL